MFILAVSCLTTSNLPWFTDLTLQVPMHYCFLQHRILLPSPVTSTAGYCFCFGSIPSFFLELCLHWSPVAYWASTNLGSSSFSVICFCLFILFMGFSKQEYWSGLPFPSPVDDILSDLSTMTHQSPVASWAWLSFIVLDKAVVLVWLEWLVSVSMVSACLPSDALLQHLPSYLGFSYLERRVSLTLNAAAAPYLGWRYLLTTAPPELECGIAPLGPPAPAQPPLFAHGVAPPSPNSCICRCIC